LFHEKGGDDGLGFDEREWPLVTHLVEDPLHRLGVTSERRIVLEANRRIGEFVGSSMERRIEYRHQEISTDPVFAAATT
jgi:hypothetical protein